tara:strand:- start:322 stop:564 length:243 start_codon:yes stop_codon:yes gene_type:complete
MIFDDLQYVDGSDTAEPVEEAFALLFEKRRAFVQNDAPGSFTRGSKKNRRIVSTVRRASSHDMKRFLPRIMGFSTLLGRY